MARLKYLIYCEMAQGGKLPDGNEKLIVTQPLTSINLAFVPSLYSFSVVIGLVDLNTDANIRMIINNIKLNKIVIDTGMIPVSSIIHYDDAYNGEINTCIGIGNVPLETEGVYVSDIFVDNELIGSSEIEVRRDMRVAKP